MSINRASELSAEERRLWDRVRRFSCLDEAERKCIKELFNSYRIKCEAIGDERRIRCCDTFVEKYLSPKPPTLEEISKRVGVKRSMLFIDAYNVIHEMGSGFDSDNGKSVPYRRYIARALHDYRRLSEAEPRRILVDHLMAVYSEKGRRTDDYFLARKYRSLVAKYMAPTKMNYMEVARQEYVSIHVARKDPVLAKIELAKPADIPVIVCPTQESLPAIPYLNLDTVDCAICGVTCWNLEPHMDTDPNKRYYAICLDCYRHTSVCL